MMNFPTLVNGNKKTTYSGVHGICILVNNKFYDKCSKIENISSDCVLWLKIDKEVTVPHSM